MARICTAAFLFVALLGAPPLRDAQAHGSQDTILTLQDSQDQHTELSLADLDALPQITIRTETPWHSGMQEFRGPALLPLLRTYDMVDRGLLGQALNGYNALLDVSSMTEAYPILATRRNGALMPIRDLGPLFIVFPYSTLGLKTSQINSQSIWQLYALRSVTELPE